MLVAVARNILVPMEAAKQALAALVAAVAATGSEAAVALRSTTALTGLVRPGIPVCSFDSPGRLKQQPAVC